MAFKRGRHTPFALSPAKGLMKLCNALATDRLCSGTVTFLSLLEANQREPVGLKRNTLFTMRELPISGQTR